MVCSITGQSFTLSKKGSTTRIAATISYNADADTARLNPNRDLTRGVTYKGVVTREPKDLVGNQLDQDGTTSGLQQKRWLVRRAGV